LRGIAYGFEKLQTYRRVLGDSGMAEIVRDNRADLMVKIRAQVNQGGGNLGIAAVDVRICRARSVTPDFGKSL
jgi:modulator of FtsH protease HflC